MSLRDTPFLVLDTETTGLDPSVDRVVELGLCGVRGHTVYPLLSAQIHPGIPIPPQASAVHHITDKMVADAPSFEKVWADAWRWIRRVPVIAAHNAAFDRSMVPDTGKPWLCTYRLARHLWPDAPAHGNQVLRYWLGLELETTAHSAQDDTLVTGHILARLIDAYLEAGHADDVGALVAFAESPIQVPRMTFGKHYGVPLEQVPEEYLRWTLANKADLDADLRWSIERVLPG